jgi:hypothetical protein
MARAKPQGNVAVRPFAVPLRRVPRNPRSTPGVKPSYPKPCLPKKAKKENSMTYDNDGRLRSESELRANNEGPRVGSNTMTIAGGVAVLAIILGVIFLLPHRTDNAAINGQPTSAATTTGSGATSPAPAPARPAAQSPAMQSPATPAAPNLAAPSPGTPATPR